MIQLGGVGQVNAMRCRSRLNAAVVSRCTNGNEFREETRSGCDSTAHLPLSNEELKLAATRSTLVE